MIASVLKTIGITLTSLSSFNAPIKSAERNRSFTFVNITDNDYHIDTDAYEDYPDTAVLPRTYTKSEHYFYQNSNITISYTEIQQMYVGSMPEGTPTTFRYVTQNNATPYTFVMYLVKIEPKPNTIGQFYYNFYAESNTAQFVERSSTKTTIRKFTAINYDATNEIYNWWGDSTPITTARQQGARIGIGTYIYNQLMNGRINYQNSLYAETNEMPTPSMDPEYDRWSINTKTEIPYNQPCYLIYLMTFENANNYLTSTTSPNDNWIINTNDESYNGYDYQLTEITGSITYDVIDVPGLMFTILTMPFTFISTAFNLTLFPGTPYQINISYFFLSIIALLVFIFLIKTLLNRL